MVIESENCKNGSTAVVVIIDNVYNRTPPHPYLGHISKNTIVLRPSQYQELVQAEVSDL